MRGSPEIELKLELRPEDARALKRRGLRALGAGAAATERLTSVYFDTPKHLLHKSGLTLRVRSDGRGHIQTVKARNGAAAGLFTRSEWERAIPGPEPARETLEETPLSGLLPKAKRLGPVFETVVDRTLWTVTSGGSTIEIALDHGHVAAGTERCDFAEIEFELKQGVAADLLTVARRLAERQAVKLGVLTKSERGYALANGGMPSAFKADPVALSRGMTSAEAFQHIAHACLRQFRLNEPLVIETRSIDSLHEARVAIRRLRSALSLFKVLVADETLDRLKAELRDAARVLGEARNLDVYLDRTVAPELERDEPEPGMEIFFDQVQTLRERAYDQVAETLNGARFRRLMLDLLTWIEAGPWLVSHDPARAKMRDQPVEACAAGILDAHDRKLRRKGKQLGRLDAPARHRVRIQAKKLRYAAEFFAALNHGKPERRRYDRFVKGMKEFQAYLGDLNDLHTGHELAEELAQRIEEAGLVRPHALFAAGHLTGERDQRVAPLLEAATEAYKTYAGAPRFWRDWND